ncbi:MAG: response regulator [Chitinophagales bacterium]
MAEQELKVLLLEDNPGDAFLIKFYLGESSSPVFQVSHAENLKSALEYLSENKFDIIISDMNLPDSFGVDTIKNILAKFPGNLVIVLTGLTDEEVGLETVRYGAQDFLVKGKFDGKVLISSVMFAFERFRLNKQIESISSQLDAESKSIAVLQTVFRLGFFEIDIKTMRLVKSAYMDELMKGYGLPSDIDLEAGLALTGEPDTVKQALLDAISGGKSAIINVPLKMGKTVEVRLQPSVEKLYGLVHFPE